VALPSPRRIAGAATVLALSTTLAVGTATATESQGGEAERRLQQADDGDKVQLVHVEAGTRAERNRLAKLGLDLTEHGDLTGLDVVLHGTEDAEILREAGFDWRVKVADLAAKARANARADRQYAAEVAESPLPSGRTSYRHLEDYNRELIQLTRKYPNTTRPLVLPNRSVEGRKIRGIEITSHAGNRLDGKPVMLMVGAHHAREWPSAEHTMEWAYELLENYKSNPETKRIVNNVRTIVVPVLNPDGFRISREADPLGDFSLFDYEMKRKNCSISQFTPEQYLGGTCEDNPAGRYRGTDLNRNYPGFWGGPGASPIWADDTYRGDSPGSEPETDALRQLISKRQVTNLITNHTYSNLVLRPPSIFSTGYTPDEEVYRGLGERMTSHNDYANQASFQLYDTSGSLEDWSYWNTGGFGFTFEISPDGFHEAFEDAVVAEYVGLPPAAGAGQGGNRAAYYEMADATIDRSLHSVIKGQAPKGALLRIQKEFTTQTSPVIQPDGSVSEPLSYTDHLVSSFRPKGGWFSWDVNPSTRPLVAGRWGRDPVAPVQPGYDVANPEGVPAEGESEEITFTVGGLPEYDNFTADLVVDWPGEDGEAVDWDVFVVDEDGNFVAQAATLDNPEVVRLVLPEAGEYTAVIENYEGGTEESDWTARVEFTEPPEEIVTGVKETWKLTCHRGGRMIGSQEVVVDRGEVANIGQACRMSKR
jgi:Zinc carboxypeptidase